MDISTCLQRTCRSLTLVAALLVCNSSALVADSHAHCSPGCKSKGITQHIIDKHHGKLVLSKSGKYHLEEDVKGTIYINSSNICLDLCCHTIDAKCAKNAIVVGDCLSNAPQPAAASRKALQMVYSQDEAISQFFGKASVQVASKKADRRPKEFSLRTVSMKDTKTRSLPISENIHHIKISNGSIVGAKIDALLVNSVFDVEVSNLTMQHNKLNAIHVLDSNAVNIHNIAFFGGGETPDGERALLMESTDNFDAKNLVVTGYTCTLGSAIELEDCHTGSVGDANVSLNICQPSQQVYFEPLGSFVTLTGCSEVALKAVKVNENVYEDIGITFCGIYLNESTNCSILDCEVCGNVDQSTPDNSSLAGLFILFSNNCNVNGYKFNENKTINYRWGQFSGIVYCNSAYALCENVQVNGNVAEDIAWFSMNGIWTVNFFDGPQAREITMRNCEVMNNATNGSSDGFTSYLGIRTNSVDNIIQNCRASNNKAYSETAQFINGFACSDESGYVRIENCEANYNDAPDVTDFSAFSGAATCAGFNFHSSTVEMLNCSASYNGNAGVIFYGDIAIQFDNCTFKRNGQLTEKVVAAGITSVAPFESSAKIVVKNSLFEQNGSSSLNEEAYGIYVNPGKENSIVIEDCDIFETVGSRFAAGIYSDGTRNVIVKNVTVRNTDAPSGAGIQFENVDVFEISGSTSSLNTNEGYLLVGSSKGVVQECKALSNGADGFSDDQSDLSDINVYIENVASKNSANFNVGPNTMIGNISQG